MLPKDDPNNRFPSGPSPDDIENFCTAAKTGDLPTVQRYLDDYGANIVNAQDNIKARAITWAAWGGCDEVIKALLKSGADIDAQGTGGKTALSWAAEMGKFETFALLMDRGASLSDRDDNGATPVDYARRSSNTAIADLINQHFEEQESRLRQAEQKKTIQAERDARAAVEERLRKLKDGAGKIKILPPQKRGNRGPGR
jgi:ankyrin repeat protein